jgi:hypothetical protein
MENMKRSQGRRLKLKHKMLLQDNGYNWHDLLIVKDDEVQYLFIHKDTGEKMRFLK